MQRELEEHLLLEYNLVGAFFIGPPKQELLEEFPQTENRH